MQNPQPRAKHPFKLKKSLDLDQNIMASSLALSSSSHRVINLVIKLRAAVGAQPDTILSRQHLT